MDVIPIYKSFLITFPIVHGLFVLEEMDFYSASQLVWLFVGVALCYAGVFIVYQKAQKQILDQQEQHPEPASPKFGRATHAPEDCYTRV